MSVHLSPAERRILKTLVTSDGAVVPWKTLSNVACGYYNMEALRVHLWRLRNKLPKLRYNVTKGVGVQLEAPNRCPHCQGTGMRLDEHLQ